MPVSTSTMPSPAASAQALQCGTPGHGSGRRRRQTPGSTRSPRPTSRLRVGRHRADSRRSRRHGARRPVTREREVERRRQAGARHRAASVPRATSRRSTRAIWTRRSRCWAPGGREHIARPGRRRGARRRARVLRRAVRRVPGPRASRSSTIVPRATACAVRWRLRGTFAGPGRFQGIEPTGARVELEGVDVLTVARRPDRRATTPTSTAIDVRAPDRAAAAARARPPRQRMTGRVQRPHAAASQRARRASPSRSPTASGSCAAASRSRR